MTRTTPQWMAGGARRCCLYLLALAVLAGGAIFHRLGEHHLWGDEALYAEMTDNIRPETAWIGITVENGRYPDRLPLYNWLTAATRGLFPEGEEVAYRIWSGAFGVGCLLLVCWLGGRLYGAEVGLAAGLLLLLNQGFIYHYSHGPRQGVLDSALTFFTLVAVGSVWRARQQQRRWIGWIGAGLASGAMSMMKPYVGWPILLLLGLHHLLYGRAGRWVERLQGPLLAGAVALAVLLPWHVAMGLEFGRPFFVKLYVWNLTERAIGGIPGHVKGLSFYWRQIPASSAAFRLFVPAILLAVVLSVRGPRRSAFGLLAIVVLGWVGLFSLFASKQDWYVFPVYPLIALTIAAAAAEILRRALAARRRSQAPVGLPPLAVGLALLLVAGPLVVRQARFEISKRAENAQYLPWEIYQATVSASSPPARFALAHFPGRQRPARTHYLRRMSEARQLTRLRELKRLVGHAARSGEPLVVVLSDASPSRWVETAERLFARLDGALRIEASHAVAYAVGVTERLPPRVARAATGFGYPLWPSAERVPAAAPEARRFLRRGWWPPEPEGRRIAAPGAWLGFGLARSGSRVLELQMHAREGQRVELLVNGRLVASGSLPGGERPSIVGLSIPAGALARRNDVFLRVPAARPEEGGVFVYWLRLAPAFPGPEGRRSRRSAGRAW